MSPSDVLKNRLRIWTKTILPEMTDKRDTFARFSQALQSLLSNDFSDPITINMPGNQPPIVIYHDDNVKSECTIVNITNGLSKDDRPPNASVKDISQSQPKQKLLITTVLISSDFQCLSEVVKVAKEHFAPIEYSDGKAINPSCQDKQCSLSPSNSHLLTTVHTLCFKCANMVSERCYSYHGWKAIALQSLESELTDNESCKSSLSAFAMELLTSTDDKEDCAKISINFSKKLVNYNLPQLSIPLLITVLQHCLCQMQRKEAWQLLIAAIKQIMLQSDITYLQKWLLQAVCDYVLSEENCHCELPNLKSILCNIFDQLLITKAEDIIKLAVDMVEKNSVPFKCILSQLLLSRQPLFAIKNQKLLYKKKKNYTLSRKKKKRKRKRKKKLLQLHKPSEKPNTTESCTGASAATDFLSGVNQMDKDPVVSLDFFLKATWQNPDLCQLVARAASILMPKLQQHKYTFLFQKRINTSQSFLFMGHNDLNLDMQESGIENQVSTGAISHSQAALWYLQLMDTDFVCCAAKKLVCLLKSAKHFDCELKRAKLVQEKHALKNAALTCVLDACQLATRLHPGMKVFTFQFTSEIMLRLATLDYSVSTNESLDAFLTVNMYKNLLYNKHLTFLWSFPVKLIRVSVAHFINHISDTAHRAYLQSVMKKDESSRPVKSSLLHYYSFENAITDFQHRKESTSSLLEKRMNTMSKLLEEKGLTFEDVSHRMTSPLIHRNDEGWLLPQKSLGRHLQIAALKGFSLNLKDSSPSIQLLIEPAKDGNGLLSIEDVFTMLQLDFTEVFPIIFSLDPPNTTERLHPFSNICCHPKKLHNTEFMDTLFHADYLLKFLSAGTEVSSNPPFNLRPAEEGLLPENLKHTLRPCYVRGHSHMNSKRSWIEAEEILFAEEASIEQVSYYIEQVKLAVRSRPLVAGINGQCNDAIHSDVGPDAQFAADFSENYDKISQHFPIFARIGELAKLQFMMQMIYKHMQNLKETSPTKHMAFEAEINRLRSLAPVKKDHSECTWVPAVYTLCGDGVVYGGVTLQPSHKNLKGNHNPSSEHPASWIDVHRPLIAPMNSLEIKTMTGPGGIYFGIMQHCRVPVHVTEPEKIVCVQLGDTPFTDQSTDTSASNDPSSPSPVMGSCDKLLPDNLILTESPVSSSTELKDILNIQDEAVSDSDTISTKEEEKISCPSKQRDKGPCISEIQSPSTLARASLNTSDLRIENRTTNPLAKSETSRNALLKSAALFADVVAEEDMPQTSLVHSPSGASLASSHLNVHDTSLTSQTEPPKDTTPKRDPEQSTKLETSMDMSKSQPSCVNKSSHEQLPDVNVRETLPSSFLDAEEITVFIKGEAPTDRVSTDSAVVVTDEKSNSFTSLSCGSAIPSPINDEYSDDRQATYSSNTTNPEDKSLNTPEKVTKSQNSHLSKHTSESSDATQMLTSSIGVPQDNKTVSCSNCTPHAGCSSSNDEDLKPSHLVFNNSSVCDSFVSSFSECPLNVAVFGEILHKAGMNLTTSPAKTDLNMTDFHPNAFVREQVRNVIVLSRVIEEYKKKGISLHVELNLM